MRAPGHQVRSDSERGPWTAKTHADVQDGVSGFQESIELEAELGCRARRSIWSERSEGVVVLDTHELEPDDVDDSVAVRVTELLKALQSLVDVEERGSVWVLVVVLLQGGHGVAERGLELVERDRVGEDLLGPSAKQGLAAGSKEHRVCTVLFACGVQMVLLRANRAVSLGRSGSGTTRHTNLQQVTSRIVGHTCSLSPTMLARQQSELRTERTEVPDLFRTESMRRRAVRHKRRLRGGAEVWVKEVSKPSSTDLRESIGPM